MAPMRDIFRTVAALRLAFSTPTDVLLESLAIVLACVEKAPEKRPSSASDLQRLLGEVTQCIVDARARRRLVAPASPTPRQAFAWQ